MDNKEKNWLLKEKFGGIENADFFKDVKRLNNGEPLAYIIGHVPFLGTTIYLQSRPLIPRPETEFWTDLAIKTLARGPKGPKILDIFSGSGCIGIALLKHLNESTVDFAEKDTAHIPSIKKNIHLNCQGLTLTGRVKIFVSDVFSNIPKTKYDYIFANPPYVSVDPAETTLQESVKKWEPNDAVFAQDHGLFYIKKLLSEAHEYIAEDGTMFIEFDTWQKNEIENIAKKNGWKISFWKDQYKKLRVAILKK